jgi:signal transduction histidine kinase
MSNAKLKHAQMWRYMLLWVAAIAVTLGALAFYERQSLVHELTANSTTLHRLASQRADQHDAHLTSLSAIFVAGGFDRQDLLLDVAATVMRFYPRIDSVNVIPFDATAPGIQTRPPLSDEDAALVRQAAQNSTGALSIRQMVTQPGHYLVIKRSPNTADARHALVLQVDAEALISTDDPFWQKPSVLVRLSTPQGDVLAGALADDAARFTKPLGSASQPLILETALTISVADVLPIRRVVVGLTLVSGLFMLGFLALNQRRRTKDAERRATLSAQETRLAHASRVNAMGEMASGMAHELAQPLTAILSQVQAGRHLAKRGDVARLEGVLDDTVSQAQRAADILDRLRRWSKPNRTETKACSLNEAAESVARLLALEARTSGAIVTLELSHDPVAIKASPVELEQVVFNLVRNALDASDAAQVVVRTRISDGKALLEVSDNGPGIPDALKPHIFEPFVTAKEKGTGLGLALCQRLVEDMDGDIALLPDTGQTTFRLSFPPAEPQGGA